MCVQSSTVIFKILSRYIEYKFGVRTTLPVSVYYGLPIRILPYLCLEYHNTYSYVFLYEGVNLLCILGHVYFNYSRRFSESIYYKRPRRDPQSC